MEVPPAYLDPGELMDGDLVLVLEARLPGDPAKGLPPAYKFAMRRLGKEEKIGEIGLKIGEPPKQQGHVWYRVLPPFRGHHYAARACRLLIPLARHHGINPLRITCREENMASRRTCELAGATFVGMVETPAGYRDWLGPVRTKCVYHLDTGEVEVDRDGGIPILLRPAGPEYSEFAFSVKRAAFREYVDKVWGWDEDEQQRLHAQRFGAQEFRVISVARTDVGIMAVVVEPDCVRLNQIFLLPEHQGKGIGRACMLLIMQEARRLGAPVRLRVLKVNPRALAFFQRLGFLRTGETETHVLMERPS